MEVLVRTWKDGNRAKGAHFLETGKGGICQDTERSDHARGTHSLETTEAGICQDTGRK